MQLQEVLEKRRSVRNYLQKPTQNIMKNGNGKYDINTMYLSERRMECKCMM